MELNNPLLELGMQQSAPKLSDLVHPAIDLRKKQVCIAYGVGDGTLYARLEKWLKGNSEHRLIWIAEDFGAAWNFPQISDEQVTFCGMDDVLKKALWKTVGKQVVWSALPGLDHSHVQSEWMQMQLLLSKSGNFGAPELKNALRNLGRGYDASFTYGDYKNVPAIVCGAGASLHLDAIKNKGLTICAGSSPAIDIAHVGIGVDPDPKVGIRSKIPWFYTAGYSSTCLDQHEGQQLWVRNQGAMQIEQWMWGRDDALDLGWSAGTAAVSLAYAFGCNPITLAGMDLTVSDGDIETKDKNGKPVRTRADLLMSARWIRQFVLTHPDRTWINTSQGLDLGMSTGPIEGSFDWQLMHIEPVKFDESRKNQVIESLKVCKALVKGATPHNQVELECEVVYRHLLKPLWNIWQHVLDYEWLFYQKVMQAYD